jgi:ribonuclease HII
MKTFYIDKDEIGIDEAGRGPLIGRVYAAAVIWGDIDEKEMPDEVRVYDSKKMTRNQRKKAYKWIIENVKGYGIGYAEPEEIDKINILQATRMSMKRAIEDLKDKQKNIEIPSRLIIDGCRWEDKFENFKSYSIVKGDSQYYSIAAASIIAKEEHDKHILELCEEYKDLNEKYDLLNNMGYGTKKHIDGIKKYGPSKYHRVTFKPIKKD